MIAVRYTYRRRARPRSNPQHPGPPSRRGGLVKSMQALAALGLRLTGFTLRRGLHTLGVALTLFLALWLGAVMGNSIAGRPDIGMIYGAGCFVVGLIYRVRDIPNAARQHLAIIQHTDPRVCLLLATFLAFMVSALGGLFVVAIGKLLQ